MNIKNIHRWLAIFCLSVSLTFVGEVQAITDSKGKEFLFAFTPNMSNNAYISMFVASEAESNVTIEIPAASYLKNITVPANYVTRIELPSSISAYPYWNPITRMNVRVTADEEITIYALNRYPYSTDAFLALPNDALGSEYIAVGYNAVSWRGTLYPSHLAITSLYDNTEIIVTPANYVINDRRPAKVPYRLNLNSGETYYLTSSDITGTIINSSVPISVVSGSMCSFVPEGIYACDHLAEMLPPVSTWGRDFFTTPLARRLKGDGFRIVASVEGTIVKINGSEVATLDRGEFYETILTAASHIEASKPVMLAQYSLSQTYDNVTSDPFMMLVSPAEQYMNGYNFSTLGFGYDYVNVIIDSSSLNSVVLDGKIVDAGLFEPIAESRYSGAKIQVGYGNHNISSDTPFGIYVYGFSSYESYGYLGGMSYDLINPNGDSYPPNVKIVQAGDALHCIAEDSEDININGVLELSEDLNGNGNIDRRTEDLNNNWLMDPGEDINNNGLLDRDSGIYKVELEAGSENLQLQLKNFSPGSTSTEFTITRIDATIPGSGVLIVSDGAGNTVTRQISIADKISLHNVRLISTLSSERIDLDNSSFSVAPANVTTSSSETAIEWQFDTITIDQIENLKYDVVLRDPLPGEKRVVTQKLDLYYIDINGNEVHSGLGETVVNVLPSIVQIGVATDKSAYTANEPVAINATYKNLSDYENPLAIRIVVYDSQGVIVATLLEMNNVTVATGGVWSPSNLTFNTGNLYEGLYEVRAELLDDSSKVSTHNSAQFLVVPSSAITASAKISTDKYLYDPFEAATLQDHVSNTTTNTILDGMTLSTTVYAPDGSTFWSQSGALPQVLPNSAADLNYPVALSKAAPGKYRAVLVVKDADGIERALSETAFEVRSSAESGIGLSGEITSLPADGHVLRTESLHLTANIENLGNAGITNLPLTLAIIDPVSQQIMAQWDEVVGTLAMQSSYSLDRDWPAMAPVGATYIAMLSATIGDQQRVLASKNITIGEKIQSVFSKGTRGRLLVLIDDYSKCKAEKHKEKEGKDNKSEHHDDDGHCKNEHDKEHHHDKDEPSSDAQRAFLEARLLTNGWSYTIVTNGDDFAREMRGNGYVAYALLSDDEKLDEQVQQELRERVYRGEGLLVSGTHDERNSHLEPALGIKVEGRYSDVKSLTFLDSPLALVGDQALAYRENAMRVVLQGADTAAKYHFSGGKDHHHDQYSSQSEHKDKEREDDKHHKPSDAAVTVYQFGQGHSVFAGFDLLAQATAMQNASLLDDFLAAWLNYTHPEPLDAIQTNVIPVTLALTNVGTDVSGRILVTLPEGVQVVDPGLAVMDAEGRLVWAYDLSTDASAMLTYWVRILDGMTDLTFSAVIQTGLAPDWQDYGTVNLIVRPGVYPGLYDAINELSSLISQDWQYRKALKELQHADRSLQRKKVSEAVDHMLKATDALAKAKHDRAGGIRIMVDNAIAMYAQQIPLHKPGHDDKHH